MIVNLVPSRFCSKLNCVECFHTKEQRNCRDITDIEDIEDQLKYLSSIEPIKTICLFGGELTELPIFYVKNLVNVSSKFCNNIQFITNLCNEDISSILQLKDRIDLCISIYKGSLNNKNFLRNLKILKLYNIKFSVNILVTYDVLKNWNMYLEILLSNKLESNVRSVEFIPVGDTGKNSKVPTAKEFVEFVTNINVYRHEIFRHVFNITLRKIFNVILDKHVSNPPIYLIDGEIAKLDHIVQDRYIEKFNYQVDVKEHVNSFYESSYKEEINPEYNEYCLNMLKKFVKDNFKILNFLEFLKLIPEDDLQFGEPKYIHYDDVDWDYVENYFYKDMECKYPEKSLCVIVLFSKLYQNLFDINIFEDRDLLVWNTNVDNFISWVDDKTFNKLKEISSHINLDDCCSYNARFLLKNFD